MHGDKGGQCRGSGFVRENLPALPSYGNQKWFHCKEKTETRKMQIQINLEVLMNSFIQGQAIFVSSILLKIFKAQNN